MKGFVKILEAIIASIIILASLTFFFTATIRQSGWDSALLQTRAEDILYTITKTNALQNALHNNDAAGIDRVLTQRPLSMLPPTIDYSLQIDGIPNPVIFIGCNCTDGEKTQLETLLAPLDFSYKNRSISIRVEIENISSIRAETNIIFTFGYKDFTQARIKLNNFLKGGGTIFMLGDLTEQQVEDGYVNETFGLTWVSGTRTNTGTFNEPDNENKTTFRIAKYFRNVSGTSDNQQFTFTGVATIAVDDKTIVNDDGLSLVKINKEVVGGNGRTVWFSYYTPSQTMNNLLKSVVMWGSGESFTLDVIRKAPAQQNIKSNVIVNDFDVYKATLTLWRTF